MKFLETVRAVTDANTKSAFFDAFFREYAKVPLGVMGKRDMECLILHLLLDGKILPVSTNRELANVLGINESKLKGYLVDLRFKYKDDNKDENVRSVLDDIFVNGEKNVLHEGDKFVFSVEDPVKRMDFALAMKERGYYTDTSFNQEIVKVNVAAFFDFLTFKDSEDGRAKMIALLKTSKTNEAKIAEIFETTKDWKKRLTEIGEVIGETDGSLQKVLVKLAGYALEVLPNLQVTNKQRNVQRNKE
jgi:DNA-binding CsgD family transcriptional regulator